MALFFRGLWMKLLIGLCLSIQAFSFSGVSPEAYFKKPLNKEGNHRFGKIDFIYMINLDQRPEKFTRSLQQLALYGIEPYRFSAVNGWELSIEAIQDVGIQYYPGVVLDRFGTRYFLDQQGEEQSEHGQQWGIPTTYFSHCMTRGAIGIVLSHLSVLQDAYDSGYEMIWVMEDDIEVKAHLSLLSELIDQLDRLAGEDGWDILFTDPDTKNGLGTYVPCDSYAWRPNYTPANVERFALRIDLSSDLKRVGSRYGAYSMIVRRSGMEKILEFLKTYSIFLPFDMEFTQPDDIRLYSVTRDVVSTCPGAISDNGVPRYLEKEE